MILLEGILAGVLLWVIPHETNQNSEIFLEKLERFGWKKIMLTPVHVQRAHAKFQTSTQRGFRDTSFHKTRHRPTFPPYNAP